MPLKKLSFSAALLAALYLLNLAAVAHGADVVVMEDFPSSKLAVRLSSLMH
jgi:hypothetical protein